jgi:sporulation protein YlmC with PRC-barrel domain
MKQGLEIITSDGKRIGHLGPVGSDHLQMARSPYKIPWHWVSRIDEDVILRKTYSYVVEEWGAEPGPVSSKAVGSSALTLRGHAQCQGKEYGRLLARTILAKPAM